MGAYVSCEMKYIIQMKRILISLQLVLILVLLVPSLKTHATRLLWSTTYGVARLMKDEAYTHSLDFVDSSVVDDKDVSVVEVSFPAQEDAMAQDGSPMQEIGMEEHVGEDIAIDFIKTTDTPIEFISQDELTEEETIIEGDGAIPVTPTDGETTSDEEQETDEFTVDEQTEIISLPGEAGTEEIKIETVQEYET